MVTNLLHVHRAAKNLNCHMCMFLAEVEQSDTLPPSFISYTINKCPFCHLFSAVFLILLCFLLVILLFKMVPKHRYEVLSSMPKHKKAERYITEKMHVLENLCLGLSYNAIGHDFNVNDSTIHSK